MADISELVLQVKDKAALAALDRVDRKLDKLGTTSEKTTKKITKSSESLGKSLSILSKGIQVGALVAGFSKLGQAMNKARTSTELFNRVFGIGNKDAISGLRDLTTEFGKSRVAAQDLMNSIGGKISLDFAPANVGKISSDMSKIALNISKAFTHIGINEIAQKLAQSMSGEFEGLRDIGIIVDTTGKRFLDLVEKAKEMYGYTDRAARGWVIYQEVMAQAAKYDGLYAKQAKNISQVMNEIKGTLEGGVFAKAGEYLSNVIGPTLQRLNQILQIPVVEKIGGFGIAIVAVISVMKALSAGVALVSGFISGKINSLGKAVEVLNQPTKAFDTSLNIVNESMNKTTYTTKNVASSFDSMSQAINKSTQGITTGSEKVAEALELIDLTINALDLAKKQGVKPSPVLYSTFRSLVQKQLDKIFNTFRVYKIDEADVKTINENLDKITKITDKSGNAIKDSSGNMLKAFEVSYKNLKDTKASSQKFFEKAFGLMKPNITDLSKQHNEPPKEVGGFDANPDKFLYENYHKYIKTLDTDFQEVEKIQKTFKERFVGYLNKVKKNKITPMIDKYFGEFTSPRGLDRRGPIRQIIKPSNFDLDSSTIAKCGERIRYTLSFAVMSAIYSWDPKQSFTENMKSVWPNVGVGIAAEAGRSMTSSILSKIGGWGLSLGKLLLPALAKVGAVIGGFFLTIPGAIIATFTAAFTYALYKPEIDAKVEEMQKWIAERLGNLFSGRGFKTDNEADAEQRKALEDKFNKSTISAKQFNKNLANYYNQLAEMDANPRAKLQMAKDSIAKSRDLLIKNKREIKQMEDQKKAILNSGGGQFTDVINQKIAQLDARLNAKYAQSSEHLNKILSQKQKLKGLQDAVDAEEREIEEGYQERVKMRLEREKAAIEARKTLLTKQYDNMKANSEAINKVVSSMRDLSTDEKLKPIRIEMMKLNKLFKLGNAEEQEEYLNRARELVLERHSIEMEAINKEKTLLESTNDMIIDYLKETLQFKSQGVQGIIKGSSAGHQYMTSGIGDPRELMNSLKANTQSENSLLRTQNDLARDTIATLNGIRRSIDNLKNTDRKTPQRINVVNR